MQSGQNSPVHYSLDGINITSFQFQFIVQLESQIISILHNLLMTGFGNFLIFVSATKFIRLSDKLLLFVPQKAPAYRQKPLLLALLQF